MGEISRPWTSTAPGDAGPYSAVNWHQVWRNAIGFGANDNDVGPIRGNDDGTNEGLAVRANSPAAANVKVSAGAALVHGIFYVNSADVTLSIAANVSGNPRVDTVILRADYTAQTVRLAVLQGTPAPSPVPPSLTQTDGVQWEIPLADVAVANGFATIVAADIQPREHWANAADGVYLDNVLNNSGAALQTGDVVIVDTTADRAVTTTTTFNDSLVAGVWVGRTNNGAKGRVQTQGIGLVRTTGAIANRNLTLVTSGTAKSATTESYLSANEIGRSLQTTSGAGLCLAWIGVRRMKPLDYILLRDEKAQNTAGGTFTTGAWQTRTLNTEVADTGNHCSLSSNQFTLQPGTYRIRARAPTYLVNNHQTRLQNITDGTTTIVGTVERSAAAAGVMTSSFLEGRFSITAAKAFELQHRCSTTGTTDGFGQQSNLTTEVYAVVELWKEG